MFGLEVPHYRDQILGSHPNLHRSDIGPRPQLNCPTATADPSCPVARISEAQEKSVPEAALGNWRVAWAR